MAVVAGLVAVEHSRLPRLAPPRRWKKLLLQVQQVADTGMGLYIVRKEPGGDRCTLISSVLT
jgi:hypothetical protein